MNIFRIGLKTIGELIDKKVLVLGLVFIVFDLILIYLANGLSPIGADFVTQSIASTSLSVFQVFYAVVIGAAVVQREWSDNTIHLLITRNVSRTEVFLGRALGGFSLLCIMTFGAQLVIWLSFGTIGIWDQAPLLLRSSIVYLMAILFSLIFSRVLTYGLVIAFYLVGISSPMISEVIEIQRESFVSKFLIVARNLVPDFSLMSSFGGSLFAGLWILVFIFSIVFTLESRDT